MFGDCRLHKGTIQTTTLIPKSKIMYLHWNEQTITDFSPENITAMYNRGYVCTRPEEGHMEQTRSIRIDLSNFDLNSENRRILRKTEDLTLTQHALPFADYSWQIGKIGKDFYETKFGDGTFSANKIKELLTSGRKDFNTLLTYSYPELDSGSHQSRVDGDTRTGSFATVQDDKVIGYAICVETPDILHYSYPFYDLAADKNTGMGMMVRAVQYAKESGKKYCYLGSAQRPGDTYKFQFDSMEWFDGDVWQTNVDELKNILTRDT